MRKLRHFCTVPDLSVEEIERVLEIARVTKADIHRGIQSKHLLGKTLGMIFEKPSMRTRISFQMAMIQSGGFAIDLKGDEIGLGKRESAKDIAKVMSRFVDAIMVRTFAHKNVEDLAKYASIPVVNGLSDYDHPCQALGDIMTVREHLGDVRGLTMTFVGDGNNVSRSLATICTMLGMNFILSAPEGHDFEPEFIPSLKKRLGVKPLVQHVRDPKKAVKHADVIYTDVWASMGQEKEAAERKKRFAPYQVNEGLMRIAPKHCLFMHCLPAHRGDEVTDGVVDSKNSVVYDEAENRLHAQKGLLIYLLTEC